MVARRRILSIHHHPPQGPTNIFMLPMDWVEATPEKWFDAAFTMEGAQFSRDMRRVTYLSQETGSREIYIRDYPGHGGQVTVSAGGGQEPVWAKNGEVFYRSLPLAGNRMFGVSVMAGPTLKAGNARVALSGAVRFFADGLTEGAEPRDGRRQAIPDVDVSDRIGRPASNRRCPTLVRRAQKVLPTP